MPKNTPFVVPWAAFSKDLRTKAPDKPLEALDRAMEVADAWEKGANLVPAYIESPNDAEDKRSKMIKAGHMQGYRDAALSIATLHALSPWLAKPEAVAESMPADQWFLDLVDALSRDYQSVPPGLIPVEQVDRQVKEIPSQSANLLDLFYGRPIKNNVAQIERERLPWKRHVDETIDFLQTELKISLCGPENPDWNWAWTQATAITALLWLKMKTGEDSRQIESLLSKGTSLGRFSTHLENTLPTDQRSRFNFSLYSQPWLAQLLQFRQDQDDQPYWRRDFGSRNLGEMRLASNARTRYFKLGTGNIYLAVLIERLHLLRASGITQQLIPQATMVNIPPSNYPAELTNTVSPGQWDSVAKAIDPGTLSTYFAGETADEAATHRHQSDTRSRTDDSVSSRLKAPEPAFALALSFLQSKPADPANPFSIGSITLNPEDLTSRGKLLWIDVILVVREGGLWRVLPLDAEEDPVDQNRMELSIVPWSEDEQWPIARLRACMGKSTWACQVDQFGAFVAGAFDLDKL